MSKPIYFITTFDLKAKTGTPTRARVTIEAVKKKRRVKVFSTSSYKKVGIDYTQKIENKANILLNKFGFVKDLLRGIGVWVLLIFTLFKEKPKRVYAFTHEAGSAAAIYRTFSDSKLIVELHIVERNREKLSIPLRFAHWLVCKKADKIIVMSETMRQELIKVDKVAPEKVICIYAPVDTKKIKYTPPLKDKLFRVGYGGNDAPYQGFDNILEAIELLKKEKNIVFFLLGVGGEKYSQYVNKKVKFFGRVDDATFYRELAKCHAFISCYKGRFAKTAFPQKIATYLAIGRPIIATDVSDCKKIIKEAQCGIIIPENDSRALARAIKRLANLNFSEIKKMSKNARKYAEEKLSTAVLQKKLERVFKDIDF